ncbi:hypothetical protein GQ600_25863 [Phytophthora cactorum]|nr:hypothetical protein GQ600_25863 [Phytophthora cactorum]
MGRTRFQNIRSCVKLHPPAPLHMQRKFADVAVPYGVSSLDENSVRTKARTEAKSFTPTKPYKYDIRFTRSLDKSHCTCTACGIMVPANIPILHRLLGTPPRFPSCGLC